MPPDHLDIAISRSSLASIYKGQKRYAEAALLYQRVLPILERILGAEHQDAVAVRADLAGVCEVLSPGTADPMATGDASHN